MAHVGNRQSVLRGKLRVNIATSVVHNLGVVFKPQKEAFFQLATERVPDRDRVPVLRLGTHPEMERFAILNRSMPCTSGATMSNLALLQVHLSSAFQPFVKLSMRSANYMFSEKYT